MLQADDGYSVLAISDRIGMSAVQVLHWCRRYLDKRQEGLCGEISDDDMADTRMPARACCREASAD